MIGDRIKQLRISLNLTQQELADKVGLSYVQIGRYEKDKSNPSSEILQKLAIVLNTSSDYLMGDSTLVEQQINDKELIRRFKEVQKLESEDKHLVKTFIDAFITKRQIQKLAL